RTLELSSKSGAAASRPHPLPARRFWSRPDMRGGVSNQVRRRPAGPMNRGRWHDGTALRPTENGSKARSGAQRRRSAGCGDRGAVGAPGLGALDPVDDPQEGLDHVRVELAAGPAANLRQGASLIATRRIGAVAAHRVEGVADRDHAGAERDLLAGEPVRVALPVPALVGGAHQAGDRSHRREGADDPLPDQRVRSHQLPLDLVERCRLAEDLLGDRDLSDVVEPGRATEDVDLLRVEPQLAADRHGEPRDALVMVRQLGLAVAKDRDQELVGLAIDATAALGLLRVHAPIGEPQDLAGDRRLGRDQDRARRSAYPEALALLGEGASPRLDDSIDGPAERRNEDAELVPPEAVGASSRLHVRRQLRSEAAEEAVPGRVAEGVVVELEAVEVVEGEDVASPCVTSELQRPLQIVDELAAVTEPGQR